MKLKNTLLALLLCINVASILAQTPEFTELELTKKDSTIVSSWMFGLGYNIVDDSGDMFNNLFDVKKSWQSVPYPSRISVGKYFENGLGIEAIAAYTKYKKGKIVDGFPLEEDKDFVSFDTRLSYDLNKIIGETGWFDPYVGIGLGYSNANDVSRGTYNGVLGFRAWFSDHIGLDVNSSGKWAFTSTNSNYVQHAIGVVYRFDTKKKLTKKGEEKLALIKKLENEKIRVNDSIASVAKAEETKRLLNEKLAQEKAAAKIAQLEKDKQDTKLKELNAIEKAIIDLGKINFDFDSSNLDTESKSRLSKLVSVLKNHPELILEISAYTDSRGTSTYNQMLSEQRLKSTINYLLENEVSKSKVKGKAFGEEKLLNECGNKVKCSESKHKENRRSEIKIINH